MKKVRVWTSPSRQPGMPDNLVPGAYTLAFLTLLWAGYQMRVHQLREQERKFRDAVESMPALAFVADPKGSRTFFNRGYLEYTGLNSEQASGSGWQAAIHPDDVKRITQRWRESQATGEPLDYETRLQRGSDGVYRWFQTRAQPLRDSRGKIVKWCAVATTTLKTASAPSSSRPISPMQAGSARWEKW